MTKPQISLQKLQKIIREEIRQRLGESTDHDDAASLAMSAAKLLKAIDAFKEKASPAATNAVTPHMSELEKALDNIVSSPRSYVSQPKKEPQHVTMQAKKAT